MPALNWGMIQDGGVFESLMHAILYAEDAGTILFGRPGKDAGQDARSADGNVVYQAKYRQSLVMDGAIDLALKELDKIKEYRQQQHPNYGHWQHARRWVLVANMSINPNDDAKWQTSVVPLFQLEGLTAQFWHIEELEGRLATHAHVREVFFSGENRVLVGLKEAHVLLRATCVGSASLEAPMVGRDEEMMRIKSFAGSSDKRVLPILGPGGIGKSRILYESLMTLGQDGWRVLWALPGTMAGSTRWFNLLNGSQQTCVAIDDPDDLGLLRAVIEQLATVERRNWRVIITCRTEKSGALRRYRTHRLVEQPMQLGPLNESASKQLLISCLGNPGQESWLHSVYLYTHGVPGWLWLIGELARRGTLSGLPANSDDVSVAFVDSCLQSLGEPRRQQSHTLLRWLALWGSLRLEPVGEVQAELRFLEAQGISSGTVPELLQELVGTGLVRNWGVGKRLHAIEPLIIREHILSSWLLTVDGGMYRVNAEGVRLVHQLVRNEIPGVDLALGTLSHLGRSRLTEAECGSFLKPVFDAMAAIVRDGTVMDQYRVADLIEKAGASDPESGLDVLASIRRSDKETMEIEVPLWGRQAFSHGGLVTKMPWIVFQIAEHVSDHACALRYLEEFRELVSLEDAGRLAAEAGKGARQLLKRLLSESKNSLVYAQPAHGIVTAELGTTSASPFAVLLLGCLTNPQRGSTEWITNWTLTISRRGILPGSLEWTLAADLREKAFAVLRCNADSGIRNLIWHVLAETHHEFHRAVMHGNALGAVYASYRAVLSDDLVACAAILQSPPLPITMEEATYAREMWSWYLEYGSDQDPVALARKCEQIYCGLSKWRPHDFFRFRTSEELAPETTRVLSQLRTAPGPETFAEFFAEAKRYLEAVRRGGRDMADSWRIYALADGCADLISLGEMSSPNALTSFVVDVLDQERDESSLAWNFAIRVCQKHLQSLKAAEGVVAAGAALERILGLTSARARVLFGLYSNVHPASSGPPTQNELDCILGHEKDFPRREWFVLLGGFSGLDWETVRSRLQDRLDDPPVDPVENSACMTLFVKSAYIAVLRDNWEPTPPLVSWIVEMITEFRLNGDLLGMHELDSLREQANFKLDMVRLTALIRSRIELEQHSGARGDFSIVPSDFDVGSLCRFDESCGAEVAAFHEFCRLALGEGFVALYWMPRYIAQLDPAGKQVHAFVEQYIADTPTIVGDALARLGYLASAYPDNSEAWAGIARPICSRAQTLRREEREHVYFGLARKETSVFWSGPGEVPAHFVLARDNAAALLDAEPAESPLRSYRQWALQCADADLLLERGRAEEHDNG